MISSIQFEFELISSIQLQLGVFDSLDQKV